MKQTTFSRIFRTGVLVAATVLLPVFTVQAQQKKNAEPTPEVPSFLVPRMQQAPSIDGVIDATEWQGAMAVGGVIEQSNNADQPLIPRPATFYMGWDSGHIYFASRTYLKPDYKPRVKHGRSPGKAYVYDDGLELNWFPMGTNVPAANKNNSYKWFLNTLGFVGDCSRLALGQQFKSWNPQFTIKTRLTEIGSAPDGGRWWEMEMSATTKDFELEGENRAGDQWRMLLGINHFPMWMQARIPCRGPYLDPFGFNVMTLVDETPAVQMTMESLQNLATDGTASMDIRAFNPTKTAVDLSIKVDIGDTVKQVKTLTVAPGESAAFNINEKLPESVTKGQVNVEVFQGERRLYWYSAPFKVGAYPKMMAAVTPMDPKAFAFESEFNPVRSWLLIKGDTYYLPDPTKAVALRYNVTSEADGKSIANGKITQVAELYLQDVLKLPVLSPGKYRVEASLELADGSALGPMTQEFEKKDEAKEFARWWGKKPGNVERILPPYTGVKRIGDHSVGILQREYELNALGLPKRIVSQGENVMAAPARLVVVTNGKEHAVDLGAVQFTQVKDWRVSFKGQVSGAGLNFNADGWVEQDGLVYLNLTYGPSGDAPVQVDSIRLEYPLSQNDADSLLCVGPGENFSSRTTMLLPAKTEGRLWSTFDTGITGSGMTAGSFYPTVWVGSERRGFMWWADNDRGWIQDDAVPAHEAVRKDGAVVLINNIVAKTTELTGQHTLAMSYNATPFKPMVKGWRATQSTEDGTFFQPFRNVRKDSKTGKMVYQNPGGALNHVNWMHPESRYPEEWAALWAEQKVKADAHAKQWMWKDAFRGRSGFNYTHMSFQIIGYGRKSLEDHVYAYFGKEWEPDTWNETYTDYAMTLLEPAFKDGGVRSTYWDLMFPILYKDLLSGLAYQLPDGRVQNGYNGWNLRHFFMRLHALQYDAGVTPGATGFHSTNAYVTVALPWGDAVLDGERDWDIDASPLDWVDNMPIERMRSMSSPHIWGVPVCWMGNMRSKDRTKIVAAKGLQAQWIWMHDSWLNPYVPGFSRMPQSVLEWGINDKATVYHPYWRNTLVTSGDPDVLVSMWQLPDRVVIGVFNYNRDRKKVVSLKLDLKALNLVPELPYQEFVQTKDLWKVNEEQPDSVLDFHKQELNLKNLPPHTLQLIGIRRY